MVISRVRLSDYGSDYNEVVEFMGIIKKIVKLLGYNSYEIPTI